MQFILLRLWTVKLLFFNSKQYQIESNVYINDLVRCKKISKDIMILTINYNK